MKILDMPNRNLLLDGALESVAIDVTEQRIGRPIQHQKDYFSGKKKHHTIKVQLVICLATPQILQVYCAKGKTHGFKMLKDCRIAIAKNIKKLAGSGYQGIARLYSSTQAPLKKPKGGKLSKGQKRHDRELAKRRIAIEHVNRRCKIFRIVKETYRGKHKNYGRTWNLVAALVNLRYSQNVAA
jgi:hypothetical protein